MLEKLSVYQINNANSIYGGGSSDGSGGSVDDGTGGIPD